MVQDNKSKKDNFKNAMCYIPLFAIFLFFTETNRSEELNKNIKYGIFLLVIYIILMSIFSWAFGKLLILIYIWISLFLWYKSYHGENIKLEVFDELEKTVNEKIKDNKKEISKKTTK